MTTTLKASERRLVGETPLLDALIERQITQPHKYNASARRTQARLLSAPDRDTDNWSIREAYELIDNFDVLIAERGLRNTRNDPVLRHRVERAITAAREALVTHLFSRVKSTERTDR